MRLRKSTVGLILYIVLLMLPIYWMLNMSLRTNADILDAFAFYPANPTLSNYMKIFTDASWYSGYINSIIYVSMNMVISLLVALPAAYAFSRYRFIGDKHMFFWLLTNRMAPPAVFLLPFFQLYSTFGLIDTHILECLPGFHKRRPTTCCGGGAAGRGGRREVGGVRRSKPGYRSRGAVAEPAPYDQHKSESLIQNP